MRIIKILLFKCNCLRRFEKQDQDEQLYREECCGSGVDSGMLLKRILHFILLALEAEDDLF
jgi:hypothetical protein